jgi:pimeloyl-ACP methyl ester carboxylesterase
MTESARGLASSARAASAQDLPLVLIHGFLGGARQWSGLADAFSNQRPVVTIDLPGFGGASAEPPASTIEEFAQHVLTALDAQHLQSIALLGHSMGGMIAQEIARQRPELIERLVLYGTGPLGKMPDRFESIETSLQRLEQEGLTETARRVGWGLAGRWPAEPGL